MFTVTLLHPWFLLGLLSAAIPLVIHLSRSRRTKKMRFSTTRFFTDQFLRSYRMSRLKELLLFAHTGQLRLLFGEIIGDEIVRPESALLPLDWLTTWQPTGDWKADAFRIKNRGALIRNHDGLLYDSSSIGYIDGLVDGLLPSREEAKYVPLNVSMWKKYRTSRKA